MPLPKRRRSRSKQGKKRSHNALRTKSLSVCPRCNQAKLPHTVCGSCGYYKGREIVSVEGA